MKSPPKYEILAFIKDQRQFYKPKALGYRILDHLENLVNKQGGKNGRKETSQKP